MLLQIMEEGVLSDARGRKVDFRNALIIMTSNVGAEDVLRQGAIGFTLETADTDPDHSYDVMRQQLLSRLRKLFRPEFLNRVDAVVVFRSLTHEDIRKIVGLEIEKLRNRVLDQGYDIRLTDAAEEWLAENGYNAEYGARPLRRLIQKEVETPLSDHLLAGEFDLGDVVLIDAQEDGIAIESIQEPEMAVEV
jgi:ATP-dependent Clp protease ATP-binding subunit ClpC